MERELQKMIKSFRLFLSDSLSLSQGMSRPVCASQSQCRADARISRGFLTGGGWEEPLECHFRLTLPRESPKGFRESRGSFRRKPRHDGSSHPPPVKKTEGRGGAERHCD